jgi:hypothetical protein
MRSVFPFLLGLGLATSVPGCIRTPAQLCQDYVDAVNAMFRRCDIGAEFFVTNPDGRRGCDGISRVTNAGALTMQCIPWTEAADCETEVIPALPTMGGSIRWPSYTGCEDFTFTFAR